MLSSTRGAEREIPGWGTAIDADGDCNFVVTEGKLRITAPGPVHGLSVELEKMNAPRVLREVRGNFVAELTVTGEFGPGEKTLPQRTPYNGAGLLLMQDEGNYVRLERATRKRNGNDRHYASFQIRENAQPDRYLPVNNPNVENANRFNSGSNDGATPCTDPSAKAMAGGNTCFRRSSICGRTSRLESLP
jgi:hypothetical protein